MNGLVLFASFAMLAFVASGYDVLLRYDHAAASSATGSCEDLGATGMPFTVNGNFILSLDDTTSVCNVRLAGGSWNGAKLLLKLGPGVSMSLVNDTSTVSHIGIQAFANTQSAALLSLPQGSWNHSAFDFSGVNRISILDSEMTDVIFSFPGNATTEIKDTQITYTANAITSSAPITTIFGGYQLATPRGTIPFVFGVVNNLNFPATLSSAFTVRGITVICTVEIADANFGSICDSLLLANSPNIGTYYLSGTVIDTASLVTGSISQGVPMLSLESLRVVRNDLDFGGSLLPPSNFPVSRDAYYGRAILSWYTSGDISLFNVVISGTYDETYWNFSQPLETQSLSITKATLINVAITARLSTQPSLLLFMHSVQMLDSYLSISAGVSLQISYCYHLRSVQSPSVFALLNFDHYVPTESDSIQNLKVGWLDPASNPALSRNSPPHLLLESSNVRLDLTSSIYVDRLGLIGSSTVNGSIEVAQRIDPYSRESGRGLFVGSSSMALQGDAPLSPSAASIPIVVPALNIIGLAGITNVTLYPIDINGVQVNLTVPVLYKYQNRGKGISLRGQGPRLWNATSPSTPSTENLDPASLLLSSLGAQRTMPLPRFDVQWNDSDSSFALGEAYLMLQYSDEDATNDAFYSTPDIQSQPRLSSDPRGYQTFFSDSTKQTIAFYSGTLCPLPKPTPHAYFSCSGGVWIYNPGSGTTPSSSPAVASGTTVVVVSSPITVIGDFNTTEISLVFPGLSSVITVEGCTNLPINVTITLSPEELEQLISQYEYLLIKTNCSTPVTGTTGLNLENSSNKCKRATGRLEGRQTGIVALFDIKDSCHSNRWWIILVSVIGGLVLIVIILVLVFTLVPAARTCIRPYSARKAMGVANTK